MESTHINNAAGGLRMGVRKSIIPAAVAPMVLAYRRGFRLGRFAASRRVWFLGGAAIETRYDT